MAAWKAAVRKLNDLDEVSSRLTSCNVNSPTFEDATWTLLEELRGRTRIDMQSGALRRKAGELRTQVFDLELDHPALPPLRATAARLCEQLEAVDKAAKDGERAALANALEDFDRALDRYAANARLVAGAPSPEPLRFRSQRLRTGL